MSTVQREVKAGGHLIVYAILGFVALVMVGPSLLDGAADGVVSAAGRTANGAVRDHTYPVPGNADRLSAPPTTVPAPRPYGTPNGPVRPLPSQLPAPTIPPSSPEPVLSGPSGGGPLGELLGGVPGVGEALESGVKALGPGLKALNP